MEKKRKQLPLEVVERGLKDEDWRVRAAVMKWYESKGTPVPVVRTVEPPETVYKKCVGDVIVCATIPNDAQVRGRAGGKCRTNKALITEVIGTFAGEPVGISLWDKTTTYYVGDEIEIENFNLSDRECSAGFHFFCTREEAERYST
jgi:hypothetical protein